jgi:hypothetical protein
MRMLSSSEYLSTARFTFGSRRRWLGVLLLTALLHILLIVWGGRQFNAPLSVERRDHIIMTNIAALPPVEKPVLLPQETKPQPKPSPRPRPVATAKPRPAPEPAIEVPDTPIRETVSPIADAQPAEPTMAATAASAADAGTQKEQAVATEPEKAAAAAGKHYQTSPPPSAELKYKVEALQKGQNYHGSGKITWQTDGANYTINGEAGALFITVLDFKSGGEINGFGVAPVIYTQKRFRKPATETTFDRDHNNIVFSSSANKYPRSGGEQDRASVVWQLASIGRGDSSQFAPGAVIDLFVAGPLDAETWRMQIVGQEQIDIDGDQRAAWHVIRIPEPGSHEQRLDIWLSPQQDWYPVKLRFTETDGDYLDMSLSNLKPLNPNGLN